MTLLPAVLSEYNVLCLLHARASCHLHARAHAHARAHTHTCARARATSGSIGPTPWLTWTFMSLVAAVVATMPLVSEQQEALCQPHTSHGHAARVQGRLVFPLCRRAVLRCVAPSATSWRPAMVWCVKTREGPRHGMKEFCTRPASRAFDLHVHHHLAWSLVCSRGALAVWCASAVTREFGDK